MLKQVLLNPRIFGGVVCALVFSAAGLLYIQSAKRKVARDVPPLQETAKPQHPPQTGAQPSGTSQGGHWHAEGTYHAGPHVPQQQGSTGTLPQAGEPRDRGMSVDGPNSTGPPESQTATPEKPKPLTPAEGTELKALTAEHVADRQRFKVINKRIKGASEKVSEYFAEAESLRNKWIRSDADNARIIELGLLMKEQAELAEQLYYQSRELGEIIIRQSEKISPLLYRHRKNQVGTPSAEAIE